MTILQIFVLSISVFVSILGETENLQFITYVPGNSNIIIASSHGGSQALDGVPTRPNGCFINGDCVWTEGCTPRLPRKCRVNPRQDLYTRPISEMLAAKIEARSGKKPHQILMNIHRKHVDANRPKDEGTNGNPIAGQAWEEYHQKARHVVDSMDQGLFLDIHGQSHSHGLVELGYFVKKTELNEHNYGARNTSIRSLACRVNVDTSLADLISDARKSFGGILQANEVDCIPSPKYPTPGNLKYYRGGYSTEQYGSLHSGGVDAIQVEMPRWARNADNASRIVDALTATILQYTDLYY